MSTRNRRRPRGTNVATPVRRPPAPGAAPTVTLEELAKVQQALESHALVELRLVLKRLAAERVNDAWEAPDRRTRMRLAREALQYDAECVDARHMVAEADCEDAEDLIDELREIAAIGARQLGRKFIAEHRGHLWEALEARPYLRVRYALMHACADEGRTREAIGEAQDLLALDGQDHLGVRYRLLGLFLEEGSAEKARRFFRRWGRERTATFAWGLVLQLWLSEAGHELERALRRARRINRHAEAYLAGVRRTPKAKPDFVQPGAPDEAVACAQEIGRAWAAHPGTRAWLRKAAAPR